jgi:hypothetical protein
LGLLIELRYLGIEFFFGLGRATLLLHHPTPLRPEDSTVRVIIVPNLNSLKSSIVICDGIEHFSDGVRDLTKSGQMGL